MPKYIIEVAKYLEIEVPVEAQDGNEAKRLVENLIKRKEADFIFDGVDGSLWQMEVESVRKATDREFDSLAQDCEVVNPDGTHDWR